MQQIKTQLDALRTLVAAQIEAELTQVGSAIATLRNRLMGVPEFKALSSEQKQQLSQPFDLLQTAVKSQVIIPVIRDSLRRFEETEYPLLLANMDMWIEQVAIRDKPAPWGPTTIPSPAPSEPDAPIQYKALRTVPVTFHKAWLANEADVDAYLEEMRRVLLEEIKQGKRIQI